MARTSKTRFVGSIQDKLRHYSRVDETTGCWIWTGSLDTHGYGHTVHNGKLRSAYRVSYEVFIGPIPPKFDIHHKCKQRRCVNPDHLMAVTRKQHAALDESGKYNAIKTHCKRGHEFTPENTYFYPKETNPRGSDFRACKECLKIRKKQYREAKVIARGLSALAASAAVAHSIPEEASRQLEAVSEMEEQPEPERLQEQSRTCSVQLVLLDLQDPAL